MKLSIQARLDYTFTDPADVLVQLEAAAIPEQIIIDQHIEFSDYEHFARVPAHNGIGERIWLRVHDQLTIDYHARVEVNRIIADIAGLERIPPHMLPGETVEYLMPSRYCPSDRFQALADAEFGELDGGARIMAMRDWVYTNIAYVSGSSDADTTALDSFVKREGVCRDFAHVMITLARAAGIPARIASVYGLGVEPQDFHAVAEVFLSGEWHLIDATGMAHEAGMAKIGIGRDAADVAFLTAYGDATLREQTISVIEV
tara:strand:- start:74900 stop:75676 length:777 start_codon:yes stop_codon:yes gene_type:complete